MSKRTRTKNGLRLLVNASETNVKVSLGERLRVVINQVDTRAGAAAGIPGTSCVITTKSQVDDDVVVPELFVEVAGVAGRKDRNWGTLRKGNR